jgi:dTDP-4-dehydrorhamnose 3,5-epimerase
MRQPCPATSVQSVPGGTIDGVVVRPLVRHSDHRGWLVELFRADELPHDLTAAMAYVSQTAPGVVRGPHEHLEQTDYFAFLGPGDFDVYLWDARPRSPTFGAQVVLRCGESRPSAVIVPPGVVHAYKNVSSVAGWVFNAPNRLYGGWGRRQPIDEIRHENRPDSPYRVPG